MRRAACGGELGGLRAAPPPTRSILARLSMGRGYRPCPRSSRKRVRRPPPFSVGSLESNKQNAPVGRSAPSVGLVLSGMDDSAPSGGNSGRTTAGIDAGFGRNVRVTRKKAAGGEVEAEEDTFADRRYVPGSFGGGKRPGGARESASRPTGDARARGCARARSSSLLAPLSPRLPHDRLPT